MTQVNSLGDAEADRLLTDFTNAAKIFAARTQAGLTQQQLAERIGTTQEAVAPLEEADFDGDVKSMLKRISEVLSIELDS